MTSELELHYFIYLGSVRRFIRHHKKKIEALTIGPVVINIFKIALIIPKVLPHMLRFPSRLPLLYPYSHIRLCTFCTLH